MDLKYISDLSTLIYAKKGKSRSISAENRYGKKGEGGKASSELGPSRKGSPCLKNIKSGETVTIADIEGPGIIQHIWMTVTDKTTEGDRYVLRDLVLRIYWDDNENPSVETPLGDFFCCGFGQECLLQSLPIIVAPKRGFNSYFPMPFNHRAKITLENQHANMIPAFFYQINYILYEKQLASDVLYFHAQWRRQRSTVLGKDYIVLDDVKGVGHYVGTYIALTTLERYWWGEGEMKFYIDGDVEYPTICGTGMEDYFGGSWSFAKLKNNKTVEQTFSTPYFGYPFYADKDEVIFNTYHNDDSLPMRGLYRFHILDPICFSENLKITLQQIGVNHKGLFERSDDLSSVAYWYQTLPCHKFPSFPRKEDRWPR